MTATISNTLHMEDTDGDTYTLHIEDGELEIRIKDHPILGPDYAFSPRREDLAVLALWAISATATSGIGSLVDQAGNLAGFRSLAPGMELAASSIPASQREADAMAIQATLDLGAIVMHNAAGRTYRRGPIEPVVMIEVSSADIWRGFR